MSLCLLTSAAQAESVSLTARLDAPATFTAGEVPVRDLAVRLSRALDVPIFLDRRMDPGLPVTITLRDRPLREGLESLAVQVGASVSELDGVVYVGPSATAQVLATQLAVLEQSAETLEPTLRARWMSRAPLRWPVRTSPIQILDQLQKELGRPIDCRQHVLHDLWPAVDLPALSLVERVTLVLAGFDATIRIAMDGSATSVDLPSHPRVDRSYRLAQAQYQRLQALAPRFPGSHIGYQAGVVRVQGPVELHRAIARLAGQGGPQTRNAGRPTAEKRYQLRIKQQPVGVVLEYLHNALALEFRIPEQLQGRMGERISMEAKELTIDQLLEEVFKPLEIDFQRQGEIVTLVGTAEASPESPPPQPH